MRERRGIRRIMDDQKKQVVPPDVLRQLVEKSDLKGLLQLCAHLFVLLVTGIAISVFENGFYWLIALLVHGVVLIFVFAPLHETIHYTAFKSRWLNNSVAAVSGFILFLPFQYFRNYHYIHHRHTQDSLKDPELIDKKPFTRTSFLCYLSGLPTWRWHLQMMWQHARGDVNESYLEKRSHTKIIHEARIHIALYLVLLLVSLVSTGDWLLWYWIVPVLLGQPFLRLYLMAEHRDCDLSNNMLENSRTTYASPLINFLAWNMPYHAEHHYRASVPFHALPALHAYTGQSVKYRGDGYWRVLSDIFDRVLHKR